MAGKHKIYKCIICDIIVELIQEGKGTLSCCGKPMVYLPENTVDASKEKHIPVIEKTENGIKVTVGSMLHPMIDEHYIEWIEILTNNEVYRKYLKSGDQPIAEFNINADNVSARAYCNIHGLWRSEL